MGGAFVAGVVDMLAWRHGQRIFLARAITDMRKGANSLASMVVDQLGKDPMTGDVFVFVNRRRSTMKVLVWDMTTSSQIPFPLVLLTPQLLKRSLL